MIYHNGYLNRFLVFFILVFFIAFLTSCSKYWLKNVETIKKGEVVVYGTIEPPKGDRWHKYKGHTLYILTPKNSEVIAHILSNKDTDPGAFYWSLTPGEYSILDLRFARRDVITVNLRYNFTVYEDDKSVYIGNLLWDESLNNYILYDNFHQSFNALRNKFSNQLIESTKRLMVKEILGTYKSMRYVCDPRWGIDCTKNFTGVEVVYPKMSLELINKTEDLCPILEWKPSNKLEVTYDLVIYERLIFTDHNMFLWVVGDVVLYKENITEPKFKVTEPLKPHTKYYWSVRLRQGDVVSNWSRYNYSYILLLDYTRAKNQWFTFITP